MNKYCNQYSIDLKRLINCFNLFKYRVIEATTLKHHVSSFLDLGFRYIIELKDIDSLDKYRFVKNIDLEESLLYVSLDFAILNFSMIYLSLWSLIRKAFQSNCFIIGRLLNSFIDGFSIGVFGFVGFIKRYDLFYLRHNLVSVFIIKKANSSAGVFTLSQNLFKKLSYKVLFKLSSQIAYVFKKQTLANIS